MGATTRAELEAHWPTPLLRHMVAAAKKHRRGLNSACRRMFGGLLRRHIVQIEFHVDMSACVRRGALSASKKM
jgi:hypothetical protein